MENSHPPSPNTPLLITGASGFIGKNLAAFLKASGYTGLMLCDRRTTPEELDAYTRKAKFVFHLAGVNRPPSPEEFYEGNTGFTQSLLARLKDSPAPILLTSSAQAGNGTDYGTSKAQAEQAVDAYAKETGAPAFVFRLPGVFGKWSRPGYNTVVATFCHNIARGLPVQISDPDRPLDLVYIDDVVGGFVRVMEETLGGPPPEGPPSGRRTIQPVYQIPLGRLAETLQSFKDTRTNFSLPQMDDALTRKLYATYLSFLPEDGFSYDLPMHTDARGSFTEVFRTPDRGQCSVNISKPGIVKGNHWHQSKNEKFLVVSGNGVIRFRRIGSDEVLAYHVSGDVLQVVDIPTGYTHNIENTGGGDLVTLMWASEPFDPQHPDTYYEEV